MAVTTAALVAMLCLMMLGLPIAFSMLLVGFVGIGLVVGWAPAVALVSQTVLDTGRAYDLTVIPLFILMGSFLTRAGISDELYRASHAWLGRFRGGLAMATIVACGAFSAVSGSSVATAATMSKVAMPPMRRYGYADSLGSASIAAGGTLGILIPPSVIMIIYGLITETDIGRLFIAGIVPGLVTIVGYVLAIAVATRLQPELGPATEPASLRLRLKSLRATWPILALFVVVMGGIYAGVFTPTESAGIGATGALLFATARRGVSLETLIAAMSEAGRVTGMLFIVLIGAMVFSTLVNMAGFPQVLSEFVLGLGWPPLAVVAAMIVIYVVLGMVLESFSMILLTVPIFFPVIQTLGFSSIWFGIVVVVVVEISLITPPIGMNLFVIRSVLPDVPTGQLYRGLIPFYIADVFRLALFVLVPGIVLFLPELMGK